MATSKAIRKALKARCRICRQPIWEHSPGEWFHINGLLYVDDDIRIHDAEPSTGDNDVNRPIST